jgi:hypothetical protein
MLKHLRKICLCAVTAYILLPAFFGAVCAFGILFGEVKPPFDRGLYAGLFLGVAFGLPIAICQVAAIGLKSASAACAVSLLHAFFCGLLAIGYILRGNPTNQW